MWEGCTSPAPSVQINGKGFSFTLPHFQREKPNESLSVSEKKISNGLEMSPGGLTECVNAIKMQSFEPIWGVLFESELLLISSY